MTQTLRRLAKWLNPLAMPVARSGLISIWGVVKHRGRRTGHQYATPIALRPTADGFVLPRPWGEGTDWCRNVRAAGGGVIVWRGTEYEVTRPEVIDVAATLPAFNAVLRPIVRLTGIKKFLRVRRTAGAQDIGSAMGRTA
ncbi:MAG TPA: nitroreductase family deazaflavin-dependent oxidoreductase [Candidatus Limnocylindria bacterium]|nr:nitroreductase family deazaflavin-dependent oxidoreductase [Candidatus Limnocylindria bacterium]